MVCILSVNDNYFYDDLMTCQVIKLCKIQNWRSPRVTYRQVCINNISLNINNINVYKYLKQCKISLILLN